MNESEKSAWIVGEVKLGSLENDLYSKGYSLRYFKKSQSVGVCVDDVPAIMIFDDEALHKGSWFMKIADFFPGTIAVSIVKEKSNVEHPSTSDAVERLLSRLKKGGKDM
jgi:hypothetical protein